MEIFWGICPEMLISKKGDGGGQEQSVTMQPWAFPFKKALLASTTAIFPGSRHDRLLQGTPPSCSSIMQNDTQCGADSWKDLVSLDHSTFLPVFKINDFNRRAIEFPFLPRQSQTRLTWLGCCCVKHSFPPRQFQKPPQANPGWRFWNF